METYFVVRDTNHPKEDVERNWSSTLSGSDGEFDVLSCTSEEECQAAWEKWNDVEHGGIAPKRSFRFHPAHNGFVPVHYEGLGAWQLEAETLKEALEEAATYDDDLACTSEAGDGHFYAHQVVSYHEVREGKWVFELKSLY